MEDSAARQQSHERTPLSRKDKLVSGAIGFIAAAAYVKAPEVKDWLDESIVHQAVFFAGVPAGLIGLALTVRGRNQQE